MGKDTPQSKRKSTIYIHKFNQETRIYRQGFSQFRVK